MTVCRHVTAAMQWSKYMILYVLPVGVSSVREQFTRALIVLGLWSISISYAANVSYIVVVSALCVVLYLRRLILNLRGVAGPAIPKRSLSSHGNQY